MERRFLIYQLDQELTFNCAHIVRFVKQAETPGEVIWGGLRTISRERYDYYRCNQTKLFLTVSELDRFLIRRFYDDLSKCGGGADDVASDLAVCKEILRYVREAALDEYLKMAFKKLRRFVRRGFRFALN